jgi:hypothetical protein
VARAAALPAARARKARKVRLVLAPVGRRVIWLFNVAECNPGPTEETMQLVFDLTGYFIPVS